MKKSISIKNLLYPLPAVMVSCGANELEHNIITVSWTGTVCSQPLMVYISLRKERHSHQIISRNKEFVINLVNKDLMPAMDWCGVYSGKNFNKFVEMKLTKEKAQKVNVPLIAESPVNIECQVTEIKELGTHDLFLAEVVAINANQAFLRENEQTVDLENADLIHYTGGFYYSQGEKLGKFGFTLKKYFFL